MIFMFVYVMFLIWIQICRKLYFTDLANPKNPNLNLDSTDYGCEIRLLTQRAVTKLEQINQIRQTRMSLLNLLKTTGASFTKGLRLKQRIL